MKVEDETLTQSVRQTAKELGIGVNQAYEAVRRSVVRVRGFGYPTAVDASLPNSKPATPNEKAAKDRSAKDRAARGIDPNAGLGHGRLRAPRVRAGPYPLA